MAGLTMIPGAAALTQGNEGNGLGSMFSGLIAPKAGGPSGQTAFGETMQNTNNELNQNMNSLTAMSNQGMQSGPMMQIPTVNNAMLKMLMGS